MSRAATRNRLLASLPDADLKRWSPHLEAVRLIQGQVLQEVGAPVSHVYFPTTAIVSLVYAVSPVSAAEIGMVGNEGVVGASLLPLDDVGPPWRAAVQSTGWGFRLQAALLRADLQRSPVIDLLLRHTQALVTQIGQTAACVRLHSIHQQLCRWLLQCFERLDGSELIVTQADIAARLGVRRASVSECAHRLQSLGLIRCERGHLSVLDAAGLELQACACHQLIHREYRRLGLVGEARAAAFVSLDSGA